MSKKRIYNRFLLLIKRIERKDYPSHKDLVTYVEHNAYLND